MHLHHIICFCIVDTSMYSISVSQVFNEEMANVYVFVGLTLPVMEFFTPFHQYKQPKAVVILVSSNIYRYS